MTEINLGISDEIPWGDFSIAYQEGTSFAVVCNGRIDELSDNFMALAAMGIVERRGGDIYILINTDILPPMFTEEAEFEDPDA